MRTSTIQFTDRIEKHLALWVSIGVAALVLGFVIAIRML